MGSLQPDPSMLDMTNLSSDLLNPTMLNSMDLNPFSDDMQMDLGDVSAVPFNSVEAASGSLTEAEQQRNDSENVAMGGVGAGPLPTGFGAPNMHGAGSTLTEFTKRRNWSQRVIEELKDLLYILTADGRFLYLSPSVKYLTGFESNELTGHFINDYIHTDDASLFIREFNESIATGHPLRFFYRFRTKENKYVIFECHGHPHLTSDVSHLELSGGPTNAAGFCRGFFMMARPYPTKQSQLLDSILEHKIESERLQARIAALKREEADGADAHSRNYHKRPHGAGSLTPSTPADVTVRSPSMTSRGDSSADFNSMPPPAKPPISTTTLTKEALAEANAFARPDSITDKMARYEGASHVDSIEMLTGLNYRQGERSHGISTGGMSPALIRGDAGIDIPADKQDPRYGSSYLDKKPKKVKSADEYVCTDCGTLDSPEWRKGPNGPKTLCNACGLRWAKKEKKRSGPGNTGGSGESGSGGGTQHASVSGNGSISGHGSGQTLVPGLKQSDSI